jgi:hypothetical protein
MGKGYSFPKGELNPTKSLETRRKISESKMGEKNPNWKPKINKECPICHKVFQLQPKSRQITCSLECGYKSLSNKRKLNNPMKNPEIAKKCGETNKKSIREGKYVPFMCTDEGRKIISEIAYARAISENNPMRGKYGKDSPSYVHGRGYAPYSLDFPRVRERIIIRDNKICQLCGSIKKITVHHIDYHKENNAANNLITLCFACNVKMNSKFNRSHGWTLSGLKLDGLKRLNPKLFYTMYVVSLMTIILQMAS